MKMCVCTRMIACALACVCVCFCVCVYFVCACMCVCASVWVGGRMGLQTKEGAGGKSAREGIPYVEGERVVATAATPTFRDSISGVVA